MIEVHILKNHVERMKKNVQSVHQLMISFVTINRLRPKRVSNVIQRKTKSVKINRNRTQAKFAARSIQRTKKGAF